MASSGALAMCRRLVAVSFIVLALASAPSAAQQAPAALVGPAYRIHPGDEIEIMVWGDARLQRTLRVLPDGTIAFPLAGQIVAGGQLPSDIERIITAALQPQYRGAVPQVTVMVKNPSGYQFSVIGKVQSPGTFTPGRYVNALEAISIAGGPAQFAQLGNVSIVRNNGGQIHRLPVRLDRALSGNVERLGPWDVPPIVGGDTIIVP